MIRVWFLFRVQKYGFIFIIVWGIGKKHPFGSDVSLPRQRPNATALAILCWHGSDGALGQGGRESVVFQFFQPCLGVSDVIRVFVLFHYFVVPFPGFVIVSRHAHAVLVHVS